MKFFSNISYLGNIHSSLPLAGVTTPLGLGSFYETCWAEFLFYAFSNI
jgi:hypothetical protein